METATVVNVQKYSIHDGGGIRTTIFFKGCPLRCAWCHNPESQSFSPQLMAYPDRCRRCGACIAACPSGCSTVEGPSRRDCTACGRCVDICAYGARETVGTPYTVAQLVRSAEQDRMFFETSGGGVTLSGGEVMAQPLSFLLPLLKQLRRRGLHIAVDTCGEAPWEAFEAVLPHVDLFLYDLKHMDPEAHRRYTGVDNQRILENLARLSGAGASLHIRLPVIGSVNDSDQHADAVMDFLRENVMVQAVSLLPFHNVGRDKGQRMGLPEGEPFAAPAPDRLEALTQRYRRAGYTVGIGG